jgi:hypothetical protein
MQQTLSLQSDRQNGSSPSRYLSMFTNRLTSAQVRKTVLPIYRVINSQFKSLPHFIAKITNPFNDERQLN